ncbi:MAG: mechanosensitive ion channel [Bacteroidaceae bacterium]|nr:mechanosensitive ion channel [Bacteroidaceae bacterium]
MQETKIDSLVSTTLGGDVSSAFSEHALNNVTDYLMTLGKNLVVALLIYIVGKFIIARLLHFVRKIMTKRNVEPSLRTFLDSLISICLYFVMAIAIISVLGIDTSSFVALFASAGLAVGMALSGTLQNFAGGVMVLIFKPYKVGDYIEAQGYSGTVKQIQIFNTIITTPDNQTIIIPNGGLATGSLKNYSTAPFRRVDINVEVAYGTNPDDVRNVLNKIIDGDSRILKDAGHEPAIPMTSMGASSIVFQFRVWCESANYWGIFFDSTEKIYRDLTAAGIEIPFQQVDVHVKQN